MDFSRGSMTLDLPLQQRKNSGPTGVRVGPTAGRSPQLHLPAEPPALRQNGASTTSGRLSLTSRRSVRRFRVQNREGWWNSDGLPGGRHNPGYRTLNGRDACGFLERIDIFATPQRRRPYLLICSLRDAPILIVKIDKTSILTFSRVADRGRRRGRWSGEGCRPSIASTTPTPQRYTRSHPAVHRSRHESPPSRMCPCRSPCMRHEHNAPGLPCGMVYRGCC